MCSSTSPAMPCRHPRSTELDCTAQAASGPQASPSMPAARFFLLPEISPPPGKPRKPSEVVPSRQPMPKRFIYLLILPACLLALISRSPAQTTAAPAPILLHAARLLVVEPGLMLAPGEVRGEATRSAATDCT